MAGLSRLHVRNRDASDMVSALGLRLAEHELPPRRVPTDTSIPLAAWKAKETLLTSPGSTRLASPSFASFSSTPFVRLSNGSFGPQGDTGSPRAATTSSGPSIPNRPKGTSRETRARTMVPVSSTRISGVSDADSVFRSDSVDDDGLGRSNGPHGRRSADGDAVLSAFDEEEKEGDVVSPTTPASGRGQKRRSVSSSGGSGSASGGRLAMDLGDDIIDDEDRRRLEEVLGVPANQLFVMVAGDLNYRLRLTEPEQALRAIHTAANDPVGARLSPPTAE